MRIVKRTIVIDFGPMPRAKTPKRQISIRLPAEYADKLDQLLDRYKETVPENEWTGYIVATMAIKAGIDVLTLRADRREPPLPLDADPNDGDG